MGQPSVRGRWPGSGRCVGRRRCVDRKRCVGRRRRIGGRARVERRHYRRRPVFANARITRGRRRRRQRAHAPISRVDDDSAPGVFGRHVDAKVAAAAIFVSTAGEHARRALQPRSRSEVGAFRGDRHHALKTDADRLFRTGFRVTAEKRAIAPRKRGVARAKILHRAVARVRARITDLGLTRECEERQSQDQGAKRDHADDKSDDGEKRCPSGEKDRPGTHY